MINKLEALAKVEGGLLLIMLVCALAGLVVGLLLGYWVGYLVGRAKGKKIRNLTASLDDLTQTLSGLKVKRIETPINSASPVRSAGAARQPASGSGSEVKFKKFPV